MALNVRGRKRPDPEAMYEVKSSYSVAGRVYAAGTKLRGDHEEVRSRLGSGCWRAYPTIRKVA